MTDSAGTQTVNLSGTGVPVVSLTPAAVEFWESGFWNPSSPQAPTLANNGSSALTGISVTITGPNAAAMRRPTTAGPRWLQTPLHHQRDLHAMDRTALGSATLSVNDSAGTQTSSLTGIGKDVTPPTTQITAPANDATVSGTVTVTATATRQCWRNVVCRSTSMERLRPRVRLRRLTTRGTRRTSTNGTHTIYSKAYDAAGNVGTSTTITVTVSGASTQLVFNGGFEPGNLAYWSASGVRPSRRRDNRHAHSGSYSARLGVAAVGRSPIATRRCTRRFHTQPRRPRRR